jgi:hypothetical protein
MSNLWLIKQAEVYLLSVWQIVLFIESSVSVILIMSFDVDN